MNHSFRLGLKGLLATALPVALFAMIGGCATSEPTAGIGKSFKGPVGLQIYSLRAQFAKDVPGSIKIAQSFGIKEIEMAGLYNMSPEAYKKTMNDAGLEPISEHVQFERLRDDPDGVGKEAQAIGLKYVGVAWIPHKGAFDTDQAKAAAKVFNKSGEVLAKYGIKCFYHTHGYEFQPGAAGPGTTAMDILIQETDPKFVSFQMDVCWVVFPGEDPAKWLRKYGSRWELMHLKDLKKGVKTGIHTGGTDVNNDVALGTGQMNWPDILHAAREAGVKHYFIEDESDASVAQIPQTLKYLEQVSW